MTTSLPDNLSHIGLYVCGSSLGHKAGLYKYSAAEGNDVKVLVEDKDQVDGSFEHLLPLVNTSCLCQQTRPATTTPPQLRQSNLNSQHYGNKSSEEEEEEEELKLEHILRTLKLYEKKTHERRSTTLLHNLVNVYPGTELLDSTQVQQVACLLDHEDLSLKECGLRLTGKLCAQTKTASLFLQQDVLGKLLYVLELHTLAALHEITATALEQVVKHTALVDMWLETMKTSASVPGFTILLQHTSGVYPLEVRVACAKVLLVLSSHRQLVPTFLEQAMSALNSWRNKSGKLQELYAGVAAQLLTAVGYEALRLNMDILPTASMMIKHGTCKAQTEALKLLVSVMQNSPQGFRTVVDSHLVAYIWSCWEDTRCRRVCEQATITVTTLLADRRGSQLRDLLLQVDWFYHRPLDPGKDLEDILGAHAYSPGKQKAVMTRACERALKDSIRSLVALLRRVAKMEKAEGRKTCIVMIAPGSDIDPCVLSTLRHLVDAMVIICALGVGGSKTVLKDLDVQSQTMLKAIRKRLQEKYNILTVKHLLDSGALCLLDLLYTYSSHALKVISRSNQGDTTLKKSDAHQHLELCDLFRDDEVELIESILKILSVFCECSSLHMDSQLESSTKAKLGEADHNSQLTSWQPQGLHSNRPVPLQSEASSDEEDSSDVSEAGLSTGSCIGSAEKQLERRYQEEWQSEIAPVHRKVRTALLQGGLLTVLSPLLTLTDIAIKHQVLSLYMYLVQPLDEVVSCVSVDGPSNATQGRKVRPASAMTSKERDKAMKLAMSRMSTQVKQFISQAIETSPELEGSEPNKLPVPLPGALNAELEKVVPNHQSTQDLHNACPSTDRESCAEKPLTGILKHTQAFSKSCQDLQSLAEPQPTKSRSHRPHSAKVTFQLEDYNEFARSPRRPQDDKPTYTRPISASRVSMVTEMSSGAGKTVLEKGLARSRSLSADSLPAKVAPRWNKPLPKIAFATELGENVCDASPAGEKSDRGTHGVVDNRSSQQLQDRAISSSNADRPPAGSSLPRLTLDPSQPISAQCRRQLLSLSGRDLLQQLFCPSAVVKVDALVLLEQLGQHGGSADLMKLSECGAVPRLVDFLRVNEQDAQLLLMGLSVLQSMMKKEHRLLKPLQHCGGTQFLMALSGYTTGTVRQEVCATLRLLTGGQKRYFASPGRRRVQSVPVGGVRRPPDIWDQILMRWGQEDRVQTLLQKPYRR